MWLDFGLRLVLVVSMLTTSGDATSRSVVGLHDDNAACEPTKCPKLCPEGSGGYLYYYEGNDKCLRCKCRGPKGPADCEEDTSPYLCHSAISEECKKKSVRENCKFSCSQSGQLLRAVAEGNLTEVSSAIAAGANPTCHWTLNSDRYGKMTALHAAARFNHPEVVVALLNKTYVDVNLQTTYGETAAYYASWYGSTEALNVLIGHNADLSIAANAREYTPLMIAAEWGHLSVVKALINANASLDVTGGWKNGTALDYAAKGDNPDIALLLIEHNATSRYEMTPLIRAASLNHLKAVETLINANASLDITAGPNNATALQYAVRYNNSDIALLLIEHNADPNIAASNGKTPLMWAALQGQVNVAKALINANANLYVTGGPMNATALHYAASRNDSDMVTLLIEHNVDVNVAMSDGTTPLMVAAIGGQLSVAKALINANASLDVTGGFPNATALYYAIIFNNSDIALLLIEHNADVNIAGPNEMFLPIHRPNSITPLMQVVFQGQLSVAQALINANASLDVTGGQNNATALHYAAILDKQDIALLLLQSGADTMIPDKDGRTPAESAKHYEKYNLADIIESYSKMTSTTKEDIVTSS